MHSYRVGNTVFLFDSGLDGGELTIRNINPDSDTVLEEIVVPVQSILNLVAYNYVAPIKVAAIENASAKDLLTGKIS